MSGSQDPPALMAFIFKTAFYAISHSLHSFKQVKQVLHNAMCFHIVVSQNGNEKVFTVELPHVAFSSSRFHWASLAAPKHIHKVPSYFLLRQPHGNVDFHSST